MHESSMLRMEWFVKNYLSEGAFLHPAPISVLDVGSYDVNGNYRGLFQDPRFRYVGLDMESGPNVDIVAERPYSWTMIADESYEVVISGQAFEHIEFFWLTLDEMVRALRRGGLLCIIAPYTINRHRYPTDCYRFDTDAMVALAKYENLTPLHASADLAPPGASGWHMPSSTDAMLIARKPLDWIGKIDIAHYRYEAGDLQALATGMV